MVLLESSGDRREKSLQGFNAWQGRVLESAQDARYAVLVYLVSRASCQRGF
jgi:hypothetical protein